LQALFGFQLIIAFHPSFQQLESLLKVVQLGALVALALAIVLIMTPAAYHRMALRGKVSRPLIDIASRLIAYAMAAFTIAITLSMFLLISVVLESQIWGFRFGMGSIHGLCRTMVRLSDADAPMEIIDVKLTDFGRRYTQIKMSWLTDLGRSLRSEWQALGTVTLVSR
jgi:Family of unknown function (DUF6328)